MNKGGNQEVVTENRGKESKVTEKRGIETMRGEESKVTEKSGMHGEDMRGGKVTVNCGVNNGTLNVNTTQEREGESTVTEKSGVNTRGGVYIMNTEGERKEKCGICMRGEKNFTEKSGICGTSTVKTENKTEEFGIHVTVGESIVTEKSGGNVI